MMLAANLILQESRPPGTNIGFISKKSYVVVSIVRQRANNGGRNKNAPFNNFAVQITPIQLVGLVEMRGRVVNIAAYTLQIKEQCVLP